MKNILSAFICAVLVFVLCMPCQGQESFESLFRVSRYANVYDFGARGDGKTDDTQAIQSAIDYLKEFRTDALYTPGSFQEKPGVGVLDMTLAGRDIPESIGKFAVSLPLMIENDYETSPKEYLDGVVVWGYGAELIALPDFKGIQRLKQNERWETHLALMIFGPRNYARSGGPFQSYNAVHGLTISGYNISKDLTGIRLDVCYHTKIKDCVFVHLHKAVDGRAVSHLRFLSSQAMRVNSFCYIINDTAKLGWNSGQGLECRGPSIFSFTVKYSRNTWPEILPPKYAKVGKIHCIDLDGGGIKNGKIIGGSGKGIYIARETEPGTTSKRWWKLSSLKITDMYHEAIHIKKQTKVRITDVRALRNQAEFRADSSGGGACVFLKDVEKIELINTFIDQWPTQGHLNGYGGHIILIWGQMKITDCILNGIPVKNNTFSAIRIRHGATYKGNSCLFSGNKICNRLSPDVPGARYQYGVQAPMDSVGHVCVDNIISGYWIAPVSWN